MLYRVGCQNPQGWRVRSVWAKHNEPQVRLGIETSPEYQIRREQTDDPVTMSQVSGTLCSRKVTTIGVTSLLAQVPKELLVYMEERLN